METFYAYLSLNVVIFVLLTCFLAAIVLLCQQKLSDGGVITINTVKQRREAVSDEKRLSEKDLGEIVNALWEARNDWYAIGVALKLKPSDLDVIETENHHDVAQCLRKMIHLWIRNSSNLTWRTLSDALQQPAVDHNGVSESIRSKYVKDSSEHVTECISTPIKSNLTAAFRCPCGKCSLEDFLSLKCQGDDQKMFPYLDVSHMDSGDRERLKRKLCKDTVELLRAFNCLRLDIVASLEDRHISPMSVARCISWSTDPHDPGSEPVMMNDIICDSIHNVFKSKSVDSSITFFNYHRLQTIVQRLGTGEDKGKFEQYLATLESFCKRNVFEVPQCIWQGVPLDSTFAIKLYKPPQESACSSPNNWPALNDVRRLQSLLADALKIDISDLYLLSIEKGCVRLHFSILDDGLLTNLDLNFGQVVEESEIGGYTICVVPGPPSRPRVMKMSNADITLRWLKPEYAAHNVQMYEVFYKSQITNIWKSIQTGDDRQCITISTSDLDGPGWYTFKVRAYHSYAGESVDGEITEVEIQVLRK